MNVAIWPKRGETNGLRGPSGVMAYRWLRSEATAWDSSETSSGEL